MTEPTTSAQRIERVRQGVQDRIAELVLNIPGLTGAEIREAITPRRVRVTGQMDDPGVPGWHSGDPIPPHMFQPGALGERTCSFMLRRFVPGPAGGIVCGGPVDGDPSHLQPVHVEAWLAAQRLGVTVSAGGFLDVDDCDAIAQAAADATVARLTRYLAAERDGTGPQNPS